MKNIFTSIGIVVLLNLLIKPAWLLAEQAVQDAVGHEAWGMYAALFSFGFLFLTFADLGLNQFATRELASQPHLMQSYFPTLFSFKALLTLVYPIAMVGVGWLVGYRGQELYLLLMLCFLHGTMKLLEFFRANFQAMQDFRTDGVFSVLEKIIMLPTIGALLWWNTVSIEIFIWTRLLTGIICIVAAYLALTRLYGWLRPRIELRLTVTLLRKSLPFAIVTVVYSIHDGIDRVMLERMLPDGKAATGLYAGAYRWFEAAQMYFWTVLPIFFARFAYHIREPQEQQRLLHIGQVITAMPMTFVCACMYFFSDKLLFVFAHSTPAELELMQHTLKILALVLWLNSLSAIFSTLLTATGHESATNKITIVGIALNIILNIIFIPEYGIIAAAWNTAISYTLLFVAYLTYFHFRLPIAIPFGQMAKLLLATLALCGGLYFLTTETALAWWFAAALAGAAYLLLCRLLRIFSIADLREGLRK